MDTTTSDPFQVLGVPKNAGEAEIRARYLELVKQFPPEREPDRFREIQAAFQAAKDPLLVARRLLAPPLDEVPSWSDAIERQKQIPPALTPHLILSFGNRKVTSRPVDGEPDPVTADQAQQNESVPSQKQHFVEQPHE